MGIRFRFFYRILRFRFTNQIQIQSLLINKHHLSLDELRSPDFNLLSDQEYSEEEVAETMTETMEQYMSKTRTDYGSRVARPKIKEKIILDSRGVVPTKTAADAKKVIQEMAEYSQKWHNETSRGRSTETFDGLAAIQAQLNNLEREIKKVNEKVYVAQLGCEQCKGPHYAKDCPLKEDGKTLEEAYYTQFGGPFQGGGYRVTAPGFYQRNNANPSSPQYAISTGQNRILMYETRQTTIPFPSRLNGYYCDGKKGSYGPQFSEAYFKASYIDESIPQKKKDPGSFTLPCFIYNVCFDNALVDLGDNISVMPLLTYLLRIGELAHTKLTMISGYDSEIPKGIAIKTNNLEDMDAYRDEGTGDVIVGEPFLREVRIKARRFDGMITIYNGDDEVSEHDKDERDLALIPKVKEVLQRSFESRTRLYLSFVNGRMAHMRSR
ncbi:hypothetical protein Tco_1256302 [Tanacetum coccineum]